MFKPFFGICKGKSPKYNGCGGKGWITTNSRRLCTTCEKLRNPPKSLKRTPLKKKPRKKTGEYEIFVQISNERQHVCYVTGTPVNVFTRDGTLNVRCFAHVWGKGANVAMRKHKPNIQIMQPWVHTVYDHGNASERKEMEQYHGWHNLLRLKDEMKEWYSQNKNKART